MIINAHTYCTRVNKTSTPFIVNLVLESIKRLASPVCYTSSTKSVFIPRKEHRISCVEVESNVGQLL